jgi:carbon-monoxide dehydrogenase iron sulfur subunit
MEVCPSGSIEQDSIAGAVTINANRCVGCKMCILACPFGLIYFNAQKKVSQKCDLCQGEPNCVKFCISGALQFVKSEEIYQSNREAFTTKLKLMLKK